MRTPTFTKNDYENINDTIIKYDTINKNDYVNTLGMHKTPQLSGTTDDTNTRSARLPYPIPRTKTLRSELARKCLFRSEMTYSSKKCKPPF